MTNALIIRANAMVSAATESTADPQAVAIIRYVGIFAVAFGVGFLIRRWFNDRK